MNKRDDSRYEKALRLRLSGLTYHEVGKRLGVCAERAAQIVNRSARRYLYPRMGHLRGMTRKQILDTISRFERAAAIKMWINEQREGVDFLSRTSEG